MIQRIQSLYLLLAFIAITLMFFFPFAGFFAEDGSFYMSLSGIVQHETGNTIKHLVLLTSLAGIIAIFILVSVFSFKKLNRQMQLIAVAFLLNALLIAGIFYFADSYAKTINTNPNYEQIGVLFPFIILILLVFSQRAIKKDIEKLRRSQRLR